MFVKDLMTTDVVTVRADVTLRDAIRRMLAEGVGSVVVVDNDGNPGGIVTETDALYAVYQAEAAPEDIDILTVTHSPSLTAKPSMTVQTLARKMADENVDKAPVMDDLDLVGMVTRTDIVGHLAEIRKEATRLGQPHKEWDPEA
jgi:CBS domain-containing protein